MSKPPQPKRTITNSKNEAQKLSDEDDVDKKPSGNPRQPTMDEVCENILHVVATKPSERTKQKYDTKIREMFKYFDASKNSGSKDDDQSGSSKKLMTDCCDVRDVGALVRGLNLNPNEATVLKIIEDCEEEESTGYVKFVKLYPVLMQCLINREYAGQILEREDEQMLRRAFAALDTDGKGWIDADVMKVLMTRKKGDGGGSEPLGGEELETMLEAVVDPETGKINVDDYISLLLEQ